MTSLPEHTGLDGIEHCKKLVITLLGVTQTIGKQKCPGYEVAKDLTLQDLWSKSK